MRGLLNEKIENTVAIDVDQLGTGMLEAAEEWKAESSARGIENWKRRNAAVKSNCGGRGGRCAVRACGDRKQHREEPQGFPPPIPKPEPSGAVSTRRTTTRFRASITITRPGAAGPPPGAGIAMLMPPMFITLSVL